MFEIHLSKTVQASAEQVWQVIVDTQHYREWNPFILGCESSFEVGSPIVMQVALLPSGPISQTETVRANRPCEYLEYGIALPLGLLSSSRQHRLSPAGQGGCCYESVFRLKGPLAPLVKLMLGKRLEKGFRGMTEALARRAEELNS